MLNAVAACVLNKLAKNFPEELVQFEKETLITKLKERAGLIHIEDEFSTEIRRLRGEVSKAAQEVHV